MNFFHKAIFVLSLFVLSSLIAYAQPGTLGAIKVDGEAQGNQVVKLDPSSCQLRLPLKVKLANLALNGAGEFIIPPGHEEMHLEYTVFLGPYPSVPGPTATIPVTGFQAAGTANGMPVYVATLNSYEVDISDFCLESTSGSVYAHAEVKLVTPEGDEFVDYPVCNYTDPHGIFSCVVFAHAGDCALDAPLPEADSNRGFRAEGAKSLSTGGNDSERAGPSGPPREPCDPELLGSTTFLYEIECVADCTLSEPQDEPTMEGSLIIDNDNHAINANLNDLSVYPNPVMDQLNIQWSHRAPLEGLRLFRSNGSLVKIWNQQQLDALNLLEISTSELPQGVYFLEARSANNTKVIKVVKQ